MKRDVLIGALIASVALPTWAAQPERELSFETACKEALAAHPAIQASEARVAQARGRVRVARTYPHNPELELELADRSATSRTTTDRAVALLQELEIAGQRGRRAAAASEELASRETELVRKRREVAAAVEIAFVQAVAAGELLEVAAADVALTSGLADFEERRLEAGAGTQLAVNLARAVAGRAISRQQVTEATWFGARAELAESIGADPTRPPRPVGALPVGASPLPPLDQLVERALDRRADLEALELGVARARSMVALTHALAIPNLRVGAFSRRDDGDEIVGASLAMSLPIFDRHQGERATARAAQSGAAAELSIARLSARREIASAYARQQAAARALDALRAQVVGTLTENLELLQQSFQEGKVSASEVLIFRRELIEGQREHLAAAVDLAVAEIELRLAAGVAPFSEGDSDCQPDFSDEERR